MLIQFYNAYVRRQAIIVEKINTLNETLSALEQGNAPPEQDPTQVRFHLLKGKGVRSFTALENAHANVVQGADSILR